ncbi:hypothetical protein AV530_007146 [Patagioenas fasciata monilis]|uniref:Uncharacterized protein n=1 Tax=Patagioenas fasciata monilis TaxID=372326 RepID=A0A1V4KZL1_PATFA|nr:hypothetical protein AV530_007146 [Patagioenas fasciata monilis]
MSHAPCPIPCPTSPSPCSQGSIVVNYTVILTVLATSTTTETVENISKDLVSAFENYTSCNMSCQGDNCSLCFNPTFTNVTSYEVSEVNTSVCTRYIPAAYQSFYFPVVTITGVICITNCDSRAADPYPCVHGTCSVSREGPQCQCEDKVVFWYQDKFCGSRISKMGVAIGVPVATLVAAVAVFAVFMVRARRQKDEYRQVYALRLGGPVWGGTRGWLSPSPSHRDKLTSRLDLYCNVDENWSDDQGFAINNQGASWEGKGVDWGALWHLGGPGVHGGSWGSTSPLCAPHSHRDPQDTH